jgi:hypothetical protein
MRRQYDCTVSAVMMTCAPIASAGGASLGRGTAGSRHTPVVCDEDDVGERQRVEEPCDVVDLP